MCYYDESENKRRKSKTCLEVVLDLEHEVGLSLLEGGFAEVGAGSAAECVSFVAHAAARGGGAVLRVGDLDVVELLGAAAGAVGAGFAGAAAEVVREFWGAHTVGRKKFVFIDEFVLCRQRELRPIQGSLGPDLPGGFLRLELRLLFAAQHESAEQER